MTTANVPSPVRISLVWLLVPAAPFLFWWPVTRPWLLGVVGLAVVLELGRYATLPRGSRRWYLISWWHRFRWHRLARNLNLAYQDRHLGGLDSRRAPKVNYPRARFRPSPDGWTIRLRLIPGVSRAEVEKAAEHLANAWRCHRVGITQPGPGRLLLRAMRRDPLADPLSPNVVSPFDGRRVLLGRDELGQLRHATLANIAGSVIGGNPGRGKTLCAGSLAVQFAPSRSTAWYVLDGKGGGDWSGWRDRCDGYAEDNLAEAVVVLRQVHERMVARLRTVRQDLGTRNAWSIGPTVAYPLIWLAVDECHHYLDLESAKARGRDVENQVRECRALIGDIMRKGRSALVHCSLIAQKCTSSSIPPDIRDLAGLRLCFGVSTTEAAVAVLGDDIRQFPSLSPVSLQAEEHAGVATVRLATGSDIYTRIRVPFVSEELQDEIAAAVSQLEPSLELVPAAAEDAA